MTAEARRGIRGKPVRIGGALAALGLSGAAAFALRPVAESVPWPETPAERRDRPDEGDAPPRRPSLWPEPVERADGIGWDLFTPPALRWDAGRGEWTDDPPAADSGLGADGVEVEAQPEPRIEVVAVGGRFRPIQLVGHVRDPGGVGGIFEIGGRRELAVARPGASWPALGVRLETLASAGPDGVGRVRAVVRDLATGEATELLEGVPCLVGEATVWLRLEGEPEVHVLGPGGVLRTGGRTARVERIEPAERRVYLEIDDGSGGVERRVERAPLRRGEDLP